MASVAALTLVFPDGEAAPGLAAPKGAPPYYYHFGIPALTVSPQGALLAFCQANLFPSPRPYNRSRLGDGNGGWVDIALRRSTDGGATWSPLQIICRNSTLKADGSRDRALEHSCQQPAPIADATTGKVFFLSSMDNWYQRVIESADDGVTWTPWAQATDLDRTLRQPGWGLVLRIAI